MRRLLAALAACLSSAAAGAVLAQTPADSAVPRYAHVFVILEENKNYEQILNPAVAPHIASLAAIYGNATQFFGEVHPSEANYVALLGGDTFGIHDDDAYYCKPGQIDPHCADALKPGYVDHTAHARHLGAQIETAGLTWKGYYENIPSPGALDVTAGDPKAKDGTRTAALYASKHSGFINFASVQTDPRRADHLVGFDALHEDLKHDRLPSFALIVPNQCNEMHGLRALDIPADCDYGNVSALIRRGDEEVGRLVAEIQATKAWKSKDNVAIVITFDEGVGGSRGGCCGVTPDAPSNFGGGHIPTVVVTNHGPRGLSDPTPYNHYSLLRTIEDAFGIGEHLRHAAETDKGVQPMVALFTAGKP
jgi:arylsulfatase A-like enzyme